MNQERGEAKWSAVAVACTGAFIAAFSTSVVAVAAPAIARDLGAPQGDVAWVLSAYLLAISCILLSMGRLADVLGRRTVYLAGFSVFAAASFACGAATTLPLLVAARVLQGLGASALMATGPAIITRAFPAHQRGRGLGLQLAATYLGLTLGPTVGGTLTSALGWHAVFHAVASAALLGTGLAALLLPRDERKRASLDLAGSALFALGLGALLYALKQAGSAFVAPLAVAFAALALLAWHEARHPDPVLPLSLLRTPAFAFGVLGAMLLYVVTIVLSWLLTFHLQHQRGMSASHAGALMTAQPAVMAVVAPLSGWAADRFGPRVPSVTGMLAVAVGLALVGQLASSSDVHLVGALAVVGAGAGLYVAPNNASIMAAAPRDRQGTAAAMAATARNVGMTCGVALALVLHDATKFEHALAIAAGLAALSALLGVVRPVSGPEGVASRRRLF